MIYNFSILSQLYYSVYLTVSNFVFHLYGGGYLLVQGIMNILVGLCPTELAALMQ